MCGAGYYDGAGQCIGWPCVTAVWAVPVRAACPWAHSLPGQRGRMGLGASRDEEPAGWGCTGAGWSGMLLAVARMQATALSPHVQAPAIPQFPDALHGFSRFTRIPMRLTLPSSNQLYLSLPPPRKKVLPTDTAPTHPARLLYTLLQAACKHLPSGGSIINTTSITAYMGEATLLDYSATKGAIVAFTRGLSQQLVSKGGSLGRMGGGRVGGKGESEASCCPVVGGEVCIRGVWGFEVLGAGWEVQEGTAGRGVCSPPTVCAKDVGKGGVSWDGGWTGAWYLGHPGCPSASS